MEFRVDWNSSTGNSEFYPNSMDSAADLLNRVALMAFYAHLSLKLETWNEEGGTVALLVPVNEGIH